ncbi:MAG: hypothetical protein JST81_01270 [Bacteroidetes bacterium]|nr:hypothetical protein [Bacteroidota bacterium]
MKLRIKGNAVRLRLTKKDVTLLHDTGIVKEQTSFGNSIFRYALQSAAAATALSATFKDNTITVFIPQSWVEKWPENDVVGFNSTMKLTATDSLYLLVEKDFICLDETTEDQSDNYENPNKTC